MTLREILQIAYRRTRYSSSPPPEVETRFRDYINEVQQDLASDPALRALLRGDTTLSSVADRAVYGLPPVVQRVLSLRETTNDRRLAPVSRDWYRWVIPDPAARTGAPDRYADLGLMSVRQQPSDASELFAESTSASDTQRLHYEVVTEDGDTITGVVTLTGTTAVSLSATLTNIVEVVDWYLESPAVGRISLLEDSGTGTELGAIAVGQSRVTYYGIALIPTPSSAIVYRVEYERAVADLVMPQDAPGWLPLSFHRLLGIGARMKHYEDQGDDRFALALAAYNTGVGQLKASVNNPPDYLMVPGKVGRHLSDLGSQFPAGTIFD